MKKKTAAKAVKPARKKRADSLARQIDLLEKELRPQPLKTPLYRRLIE